MSLLAGLCSRMLAVALAVAAAQLPIYYAAYTSAAAGARAEAEARLAELEAEAGKLALSLEDFIRRHETNADAAFQASGRLHRSTVERQRRYAAMDAALRQAAAWQKPWVLAQHFEPALHGAARYEPGLPLTLEGLAYAVLGVLLAWLVSAMAGAALPPRTAISSRT